MTRLGEIAVAHGSRFTEAADVRELSLGRAPGLLEALARIPDEEWDRMKKSPGCGELFSRGPLRGPRTSSVSVDLHVVICGPLGTPPLHPPPDPPDCRQHARGDHDRGDALHDPHATIVSRPAFTYDPTRPLSRVCAARCEGVLWGAPEELNRSCSLPAARLVTSNTMWHDRPGFPYHRGGSLT